MLVLADAVMVSKAPTVIAMLAVLLQVLASVPVRVYVAIPAAVGVAITIAPVALLKVPAGNQE